MAVSPASDPDWPCQPRFAQEFTAATFWSGPKLPAPGAWTADLRVVTEANALAERDMSVHDGIAHFGHFADTLKPAERQALLPALFVGVVYRTNQQRDEIIIEIKALDGRKRRSEDLPAQVKVAFDELPALHEGEDRDRSDALLRAHRDELLKKALDDAHDIAATEQKMRNVCQQAVELEDRLTIYAGAIKARL